jgi:multiple sugar transport system substrate-binding protein
MNKRFITGTVAVLAVVVACVAAFAAQAKPQGKVKITYFTFSAAPDHLNSLKALIGIFEKRNPGIEVDYQTAAYTDYFTKLQTEVAGGKAPDTFELDYGSYLGYATSGALLDLGRLAKGDRSYNPSRYYPRAYDAFSLKGRQYALPESFSDVLLFYNKDLFRAAGVPFPTSKWTWKDEQAAAKKLTDASKGVWGDFQPIQFFEFYKVLAQAGGTFFNAAGTKATFDSPAGIAAANWLLSKPGTVMPTAAQMGGGGPDWDTNEFKLGKLAMWHNGIWQFATLKNVPFDWDVVVEPGDKAKANHFFADAVAISSKSKHAQAAWAWLKFLSGSNASVKARVGSGWELAPVQDKAAYKRYLAQRPPANRQAVLDALANPVLTPTIKSQTQMQDDVTHALEKAELGQMTAAEALHSAAAQVNALLKADS